MTCWAVFVDRDGVLTDPVVAPVHARDMRVIDGAARAVEALKSAGALVIVVTNQPEISRGNLTWAELELMHVHLREELAVDDIVVCPHAGSSCACRKPRAGMLLDAADRFGIGLSESWMVGDRWVDIAAGRAAGATTVLIDRPYSWAGTSAGAPAERLKPDVVATDVGDAAARIVGSRPFALACE